MKPLIPSLKEKKRYMALEILSRGKIKELPIKEIQESMLQLKGEIGLGNAGLIFLKNKWKTEIQRGILKVNNLSVDDLKASITMINKAEGKEIIVKSVGISGTLKKATEKYLK
jgi:ribonuclease P/MRP protein subunit POP5